MANRAAEAARPLIDARGHQLDVVLPDQSLELEADSAHLEQVVVNLLTNAAKYTAPGGRICLTVERLGAEGQLAVRDNGAGLARDLLPRLFDLFAQEENGSQGGLGIGLHLVRTLVRMHGGTITASSDGPGKGSDFVVRLPLAVEACVPDRGAERELPVVISQDR